MYTLQDLNPKYDLEEKTWKIEDKLQSVEIIAIKEEPGLEFPSHEMTIEDPKINRRKQKHKARKSSVSYKKSYNCTLCGKDALSYHLFTKHMIEIHGGKYECSVCKLNFDSSDNLKQHKSVVHNIIPLQCPICQIVLKSISSVKVHIDTVHEKKRPYACSICGKRFGTTRTRNKHEATHIGTIHKLRKQCFGFFSSPSIQIRKKRHFTEAPLKTM